MKHNGPILRKVTATVNISGISRHSKNIIELGILVRLISLRLVARMVKSTSNSIPVAFIRLTLSAHGE